MTPSKSKTTALSIHLFGRRQTLAGANRHAQPILPGRVGTVEFGAVITERVIRPIEVDVVEAGRRSLEIEIPPGLVRFGSARQIAERDEQPVHVLRPGLNERAEGKRLAFQRELEHANALLLPHLAG